MENNMGITLVAVIRSVKMILYKAKGIKITKALEELPIVFEKYHHIHKKKKKVIIKKIYTWFPVPATFCAIGHRVS
jgi:protein required for attachment to host cells